MMRLHMRSAVSGVNSEGWVFVRQHSFDKLIGKGCVGEARRGVGGEGGGGNARRRKENERRGCGGAPVAHQL